MRNPYYLTNTSDYKDYLQQDQIVSKNNNNKEEKKLVNFFDLGDKAPEFTLPGIVNKNPTEVSLSDYKGKWVLLYFYGSDFTFV